MARIPASFDENAALQFDPFEGDSDDNGFSNRVMNEIVTLEEDRRCSVCQGKAPAGTRARRIVDTALDEINDAESFADYERQRQEHHICATCCVAATKDDDGEALGRRQELGANRASRQSAA